MYPYISIFHISTTAVMVVHVMLHIFYKLLMYQINYPYNKTHVPNEYIYMKKT